MKVRQLFLITVLIMNSLLPLMSVQADAIEKPQASASSSAEKTIADVKTVTQEPQTSSSVTIASENKTELKAPENQAITSETTPLQKAAGIVEVTDSESFVAAWNDPDTQKIIVTDNFDYTQSAVTQPRQTDIEITSDSTYPTNKTITFVNNTVYGLQVDGTGSVSPNISIHDINFKSTSGDNSLPTIQRLSDVQNSILYRNTSESNSNTAGTLTLSNVTCELDNNSAQLSGNAMSAFVVPGMQITLQNHLAMSTRGTQLVGLSIHAEDTVRYKGVHDNLDLYSGNTHSFSFLAATWSTYANLAYIGTPSNEYFYNTNASSGDIDIDSGAKVYLSRLNDSCGDANLLAAQTGVIAGEYTSVTIKGQLVMSAKDAAFVFKSSRGPNAPEKIVEINVNSGGVLAIQGTKTSAPSTGQRSALGVIQAFGDKQLGRINIRKNATFYLKTANGYGQTFVSYAQTRNCRGIELNIDSPRYVLIADAGTSSSTGTWAGYCRSGSSGAFNANFKADITDSNVSFYQNISSFNSGSYLTNNPPADSSNWGNIDIKQISQRNDGTTKNGYYQLTGATEAVEQDLMVRGQQHVLEITSHKMNFLDYASITDADTAAKRTGIPNASDQANAVSDADHFIRGQMSATSKLVPVFTTPDSECSGMANFATENENDGITVTWQSPGSPGVVDDTVTTDSNGIFVFESKKSMDDSVPEGVATSHVKYQIGNNAISVSAGGQTYETNVRKTPTYAPPVYDLASMVIVGMPNITFKTAIAADEIILNAEDSAEQYVPLVTLTKAANSENGEGKNWTFDMAAYNNDYPDKPITANMGIEFWVKAQRDGESIESTRITHVYHDYTAEAVTYRNIAPDAAMPFISDTIEMMRFNPLKRGKNGMFNVEHLDLSRNYGYLTVDDGSVHHNKPWQMTARLESTGAFADTGLQLQYVDEQENTSTLSSAGDSLIVATAPQGNNGASSVRLDTLWNQTANGHGWYLTLNSWRTDYSPAKFNYDDDDGPVLLWQLGDVPDIE
ncbi:hypothetical protein FGL85_03750 [Leuconostoc pseudomesenteroides]|uniref:WxL domain-containing protein n=2 Tax=Leuconostoc pseudomesenteroides TaxID=33968 RepID=A0A5B8SWY6_LEUPS|nr:pectate lyase-like adhesive domain-containing protein [Leuconostoc pseudomesenteroides]QEA41672.1 hypothetical protein FGL85_03750 [Leuconostoc pseudomesenteroides]